jgi:three-Cys-motif partner protein
MSNIKPPRQDEIGPWSEDKLTLLGKYLQAYSYIMNRQNQKGNITKYHYVDAFAGAVYAKAKKASDDEETRYIEGSPLRALQTNPPFDVYWFLDLSAGRSKKLAELKASFADRDIRVHRGNCNTILQREVAREITRSSRQRAVVFLDPYGLQVEWNTLKALADARTFDVFVNFPTMGVTRILRRNSAPDEEERKKISRIMGDSDWLDSLYQPSPQPDIWGVRAVGRDVMPATWLAEQYANRVQSLFEYVSVPEIMYNTRNSPLYALFLASHKAVAVKIVNETTQKYDRERMLRQPRSTPRFGKTKSTQESGAVQSSFMDEPE